MPGIYSEEDYDLAGFAVGIAEKSQLVTGSEIAEGDVLLGTASSGIHSNGYSLVRKVFFKDNDFTLTSQLPELPGQTLGDALLTPTRIYVETLLPLVKKELVKEFPPYYRRRHMKNIPGCCQQVSRQKSPRHTASLADF